MILATVLVLGAMLTAFLAPRLLSGLERTPASPAGLLYVWWSLLAGVASSVVVALGVVLVPGHGEELAPLVRFLASCWTALTSSRMHADAIVGGLIGTVIAVGLIRVTRRVVRSRRAVREKAETTMWMLEPAGHWEHGVLWLEHKQPLAFSIGGRTKAIVASTGLREQLSPAETDAVLAHERAHLSGRHHLQVLLADTLAAAFPVLPLFRQAPAAVRRLIELAADDKAARHVGAPVVRQALVRVASGGQYGLPPAALGAATSAIELRLARLSHVGRTAAWSARLGEKVCFVAVGALAPALTGAGSLAVLAVVSCM